MNNGAKKAIEQKRPYRVKISVQGTSDLLFHRWNVEAQEEKSNAKKGSAIRKTDDVDSYLYKENGVIVMPTEYFKQSIIKAAKYQQDPRSARKSALDLFKSSIAINQKYVDLVSAKVNKVVEEADYLDKRKVTVNRAGITRTRPAFLMGWKAEFEIMVLNAELIEEGDLYKAITDAGTFEGVGDYRPTYGRFMVTKFEKID